MKDSHIIQRQILEVDFPSKKDAVDGQFRLEQIYMNDLLPVIERTFSTVAGSEKIVIDRLELDLGQLSPHHFEEELKIQLESVLTDELHIKIQDINAHTNNGFNSTNGSQRDISIPTPGKNSQKNGTTHRSLTDAFEFFLKSGRLPWWAPADLSPADLAEGILSGQPEMVTSVIQSAFSSGIKKKRFLYQLPDHVLLKFLKNGKGFTTTAKRIGQLLADLTTIQKQKSIAQLPLADFRRYFWESAFITWIPTKVGSTATPSDFLITLLKKTGRTDSLRSSNAAQRKELACLILFFTHLLKKRSPNLKKVDSASGYNSELNNFLSQLHNRLSKTGKKYPVLRNLVEVLIQVQDLDHEGAILPINSKSNDRSTTQKKEKNQVSSNITQRRQLNLLEENESLEIQNAGLVILAQFLPLFFEAIDLVRDKEFVSEESAIRAALILEYICTGELKMPEHDMVLHKLLCGLPPDTPIPGFLEITDKESEEVKNLLTSVVEHWKALKGTSIRGLRQTFLNREGLLTHEPNGWSIYIERTTIDILIDHLPWSMSIVKLPWNEDLIYVEW